MSYTQKIFCFNCGRELDAVFGKEKHDDPCPYCGGVDRDYKEPATDGTGLHDGVRITGKEEGIRGNAIDVIAGEELCKADGSFVEKNRLIDKCNDVYRETIKKDGKVICDVREKLTEHQGHGSAKFKNKNEGGSCDDTCQSNKD
jgi:hypothetical protein